MSQVIGILSGKGGVGKTTLVANLAAALANQFGRNVVVVDTNVNTAHLGLHLGLYEDLPVTLKEIVRKNMDVSYAIYLHPTIGIRILPAPLKSDGLNLTKSKLREITKELKKSYEFVILDCSPGLGKDAITAIAAMDSALVVMTPDFPSVVDALKTIQLLEKMNKKVLGIVVNKSNNERHELTEKEIESTCGVNVVENIPYDTKVSKSIAEGVPVVLLSPHSKASNAIKNIAAKLIGEDYTPTGIFERIKEAFSKPRLHEQKRIYIKPETSAGGKEEKIPKEKTIEMKNMDIMTKSLKRGLHDELKKEVLLRLKQRLVEKHGKNKRSN